ncbi:MAG: Transglycosylase protein [Variovorax sp.]|nr:Transglycosylase protein [Variovorax sp.]
MGQTGEGWAPGVASMTMRAMPVQETLFGFGSGPALAQRGLKGRGRDAGPPSARCAPHVSGHWRRPPLLLALVLALWQVPGHASDIFGYVDEKGVPHFALRQTDPRYQPFLRGGKSLDGANGMRPMGRNGQGVLGTMNPVGRDDKGAVAIDNRVTRASQALVKLFEASPAYKSAKAALHQAAKRHAIDYELLQALIATESGFDTLAVSPKGAIGLMQLMPATAQRYGVEADERRTLETKLHDPNINIATGSRHLRNLIAMFGGDLDLALAAYNAGEGAVQRAGNKIPNFRETQDYVKTVLQIYAFLKPQGQGERGLGGKAPGGRIRVELAVPNGGALGRGNMPPQALQVPRMPAMLAEPAAALPSVSLAPTELPAPAAPPASAAPAAPFATERSLF